MGTNNKQSAELSSPKITVVPKYVGLHLLLVRKINNFCCFLVHTFVPSANYLESKIL